MFFLSACAPNLPAALDSGVALTAVDEPPVSVFADGIEGGAFLSALEVDGRLLALGGTVTGGEGRLAWIDGDTVCVEADPLPHALWWGAAVDDTEWWAVGEAGYVLHEAAGVRDERVLDPNVDFFGIYADGEELWAIGTDVVAMSGGAIWHYAGGTWSLALGNIPGPMLKGWGGWFVGDMPMYHLEGGEIVDRTLDPPQRLVTVIGRAEDDVWAVGGGGDSAILHYDGADWTSFPGDPACTGHALNGVWTEPGDDLWIAGEYGTVARHDGATWSCPSVQVSFQPLHSARRFGDDVYFFGGNYYDEVQAGTIVRWGRTTPATVSTCP